MKAVPLCTTRGITVFQEQDDPRLRVFYTADLSADADGSEKCYRLDNNPHLALDDIHGSAGYPHGDWRNVLVPDPHDRSVPFVDAHGFCVSKTSYRWLDPQTGKPLYPDTDRRSWVDAEKVPYAVPPGKVRILCKGILCGCAARITRTTDGRSIDCVTADFSGNSIGEASLAAARFFDPSLSARNGDEREIYLYEFFPGTPAVIDGVTYSLIRANAA